MAKWLQIIVGLFLLFIIAYGVFLFIDWAVIHATFVGSSKADCNENGACWAMITARFSQFIYGFYPVELRWRVNLAFILLLLGIAAMTLLPLLTRTRILLIVTIALFIVYLLYGGVFLQIVPTDRWGGFSLTLFLSFGSIVVAFPIALLLALGRNSQLTILKSVCVLLIELVRGVPLISILFFASVMLPLFFTQEVVLDKLLRAFFGIAIFQGAYLAEVIRAGLNSVPKGQTQAAQALGLNYWQIQYLIVLPQALRRVIPGIVNNFIALFKDTTLVLIIGIYDFLGIVQAATTSPQWLGTALEAYIFCALVYWIICFSMSLYSKHLENKYGTVS